VGVALIVAALLGIWWLEKHPDILDIEKPLRHSEPEGLLLARTALEDFSLPGCRHGTVLSRPYGSGRCCTPSVEV
jgi:hypothetical protein